MSVPATRPVPRHNIAGRHDRADRDPRAFTFDPAKMPGEERLDFAADNASDISRLVADAEQGDALRAPDGWDLIVYAFDDPDGAGIIVAVRPSKGDPGIPRMNVSGLFVEWKHAVPRDGTLTDHERALAAVANVVDEANVLLPYAQAMFSASSGPLPPGHEGSAPTP